MKPLMLNGHTRALTQIKYNVDGDLLFSAAKDDRPCVWYSHNGERLGTFDGHKGTVWSIDVTYNSDLCLTGSGDNSCGIWDVNTGQMKYHLPTLSPVRTSVFSYDARKMFFTTDKAMKQPCTLQIFPLSKVEQEGNSCTPLLTIEVETLHKVTSAIWGPCDEYIVTGHEDGTIARWDSKTGELLQRVEEHKATVNDLQPSADFTMMISASKDTTAKLFDIDNLSVMKTYRTERPVNSAAISPLKEHVVLGGGQEAMSVTTTHGKAGKFDARFFHMIFEEELGRVKGHFGPINTVAFHPSGRSGGEDGYIRVHQFDQSYFDFEFEH